jgi:hypothetical protein
MALAQGETVTSSSVEETAMVTAQFVAQTKAMYAVFTADYDRIAEDLHDIIPKEEIEEDDDI